MIPFLSVLHRCAAWPALWFSWLPRTKFFMSAAENILLTLRNRTVVQIILLPDIICPKPQHIPAKLSLWFPVLRKSGFVLWNFRILTKRIFTATQFSGIFPIKILTRFPVWSISAFPIKKPFNILWQKNRRHSCCAPNSSNWWRNRSENNARIFLKG